MDRALLDKDTLFRTILEQVIYDKFVTLPNGQKIHYVEAGPKDAPVLMLAHGFLGSWKHWKQNILPLVAFSPTPRRVIAFDWPGFGSSDKPETGYSIFYYSGILKSFARALSIEQFDLMGHSMGGKYCLAFTILNPGTVRSLTLVASDGFSKDPWWANHTQNGLLRRFIEASARMFGNPQFVKANLRRVFFDAKYHPSEAEIQEIAEALSKPEQAAAIIAMSYSYSALSLQRTKLANRLGEISCPTLLVWGQQDRSMPLEVGYLLREKIPNSKLYLFDHCGHMPQVEKASEFNRLVTSFLERAANSSRSQERRRVA